MKFMTISEFFIQHRGGPLPDGRDLRDAGFIVVQAKSWTYWSEMHQWCSENLSLDNYTWIGTDFWFDNQRDATLFALHWA